MLFSQFRKCVQDHGLLEDGEGVVVAVSGGMDSMVLLDCFARLKRLRAIRVIAAHMNHRLRGRASDADEAFVRRACAERDIECVVARKKPRAGANLQDAARRARYAFFEALARERGVRVIATGHHADDQAETVLLHLLRGAGLRGLSGIRTAAARGDLLLLRPLLLVTRAEIEAYARRRLIAFREDATNAQPIYARNRLRHALIPALKRFNPRIVEALSMTAACLAADGDALDLVAHEAFRNARTGDVAGGVALARAGYLELPKAVRTRVLALAFARASGSTADLNADQLRRMDEIALGQKPRGEYRLPTPWRFFRRGDLLIIRR